MTTKMTTQISEQDKLELAAIAPMLSEAERAKLGVAKSLDEAKREARRNQSRQSEAYKAEMAK